MPSAFENQDAQATAATNPGQYMREQFARQTLAMERMARRLFDLSHPVDEYQSTPGIPQQWPGGNLAGQFPYAVQLTPSWELPEKIESILWTIPVGITAAWAKLSDRWISLYGGAATTEPVSGQLINLTIILNRDDDRLLLMAGTPPAGPCHFELMGMADEIYGNA